MFPVRPLFLAVVLILGAAGCKRHTNSATPPPGAVVFERAQITLVPGEHWVSHSGEVSPPPSLGELCRPALDGREELAGITLRVFLMEGRLTPAENAARYWKQLEADAETIKTSLFKETLSSRDGLRILRIQCSQKVEQQDHKWLARTHLYLFKNARGRSVGILYSAPSAKDSTAVHQMIVNTLMAN